MWTDQRRPRQYDSKWARQIAEELNDDDAPRKVDYAEVSRRDDEKRRNDWSLGQCMRVDEEEWALGMGRMLRHPSCENSKA